MEKNIQIKEEPKEHQIKNSYPLVFICQNCGIRFSNQNTLNAHCQYYCIKQTKSIDSNGIKRKSSDNSFSILPSKRLLMDNHSQITSSFSELNKKIVSFNHPMQIAQFIYIPIPILSADIDKKSLDLTKLNTQYENKEKFYQCKFCLIHFQSLKTLSAHQNNYCIEYKKCYSSLFTHRLNNNLLLFKCTICLAMFNNENILLNHILYVHTNEKLIQCLQCQSKFSSKWNLIRHIKFLHTNIKYTNEDKLFNSKNFNEKFSCPFCQTKLGDIQTLKQHINNHCTLNSITNGKKTLTYCASCQISFQHKTSYDAHKMYYCQDQSKPYVKTSD